MRQSAVAFIYAACHFGAMSMSGVHLLNQFFKAYDAAAHVLAISRERVRVPSPDLGCGLLRRERRPTNPGTRSGPAASAPPVAKALCSTAADARAREEASSMKPR